MSAGSAFLPTRGPDDVESVFDGEVTGAAARPPVGYLPGLDGLRAVAVAAVVAFHLGELPGGFLGVDVFFVVSGFLITRLLLAERERTGRVALGAFWGRRFRRLIPALLLVVAAVAVASRAWFPAWRLTDIRNDALGALGYVANWRFVASGQSYFSLGAAPSPLRHMWSLAIEEQFYVIWPLLVVAAARLGRRRPRWAVFVLAAAVAGASATWMAVTAGSVDDLSRVYYGTDTRIFALAAGAWLATWWDPLVHRPGDRRRHRFRNRRLAAAAVPATLALGVFFALGAEDARPFYGFGFQAVAVLAAVVVAGVATGVGPVARVFRHPVLVWIGKRSYGIYLWSWPVQVFASERFRLDRLALDGVTVAGAVVLATLSYWLVEEPVRLRRRPSALGWRAARVADPPPTARPASGLAAPAFACVALIAVVGLVVGTAVGAPPAPEYLQTTDDEAAAEALAPSSARGVAGDLAETTTTTALAPGGTTVPLPPGPFDRSAPVPVPASASADPVPVRGRPLRIMVTGDSVGFTLAWQLGRDVTDSVELDDRALIGCGVMPAEAAFIVGDAPPARYRTLCRRATEAESRGLAERPDVVLLVLGAWEVYDQSYRGSRYDVGSAAYRRFLEAQLQSRIDRYRGAGAATVIAKVPCFAENAAPLGDERHEQRRIDWVNARIGAVAARNPGWVRTVDPTDVLCDGPDDAKPTTPDGIPLREDGAHFERGAAVWLWNDWLAGQVAAAFQGAPKTWPPPTTTKTTSTVPFGQTTTSTTPG